MLLHGYHCVRHADYIDVIVWGMLTTLMSLCEACWQHWRHCMRHADYIDVIVWGMLTTLMSLCEACWQHWCHCVRHADNIDVTVWGMLTTRLHIYKVDTFHSIELLERKLSWMSRPKASWSSNSRLWKVSTFQIWPMTKSGANIHAVTVISLCEACWLHWCHCVRHADYMDVIVLNTPLHRIPNWLVFTHFNSWSVGRGVIEGASHVGSQGASNFTLHQ